MAKQIFGTGINNSPTLCGVAASVITDVRGKAVKFDDNGKIVLVSKAGDLVAGIAIPTAGDPEGKVLAGGTVDYQIKDCGMAIAGAEIKAGSPVMADANGKVITATAGNFVIGFALNSAVADDWVQIQIAKGYFPT